MRAGLGGAPLRSPPLGVGSPPQPPAPLKRAPTTQRPQPPTHTCASLGSGIFLPGLPFCAGPQWNSAGTVVSPRRPSTGAECSNHMSTKNTLSASGPDLKAWGLVFVGGGGGGGGGGWFESAGLRWQAASARPPPALASPPRAPRTPTPPPPPARLGGVKVLLLELGQLHLRVVHEALGTAEDDQMVGAVLGQGQLVEEALVKGDEAGFGLGLKLLEAAHLWGFGGFGGRRRGWKSAGGAGRGFGWAGVGGGGGRARKKGCCRPTRPRRRAGPCKACLQAPRCAAAAAPRPPRPWRSGRAPAGRRAPPSPARPPAAGPAPPAAGTRRSASWLLPLLSCCRRVRPRQRCAQRSGGAARRAVAHGCALALRARPPGACCRARRADGTLVGCWARPRAAVRAGRDRGADRWARRGVGGRGDGGAGVWASRVRALAASTALGPIRGAGGPRCRWRPSVCRSRPRGASPGRSPGAP
jgi:hypothetical protein